MLESKSKKKTLTIKKPLKTYTYALNGTCRNTNYTPKYLRLSKIKYIVYGENHGVYQKSRSNYHMDLSVLSGEFYDQAEWIPFKDTENWYDDDTLQERINHRLAIDPENVQKIEINGDVFTLDRVD